ncbi:putative F-box protein At3g10240 [Solanum stenotomum]|uniref:putative F-box protein At3g10240 n=1 Tax=Solanum stenotomum TaxID=172797 RepID=UPI0020D0B4B4|nr:putative F-box protein At3g10240 [Solanum stenotomum]XP_049405272.1 putative F-box protein At3g10240 [Solanum stenotomum]
MEEDKIPQDITIQIFSWLPVKSLICFRCVSKFHNSIVLEPNFVDLHLSNYSKINGGDTKLIACVDDVCYAIEDHHDEEDGNATKYHQIDNFSKLYDRIINFRLDYNYHFESDNGLFCIWDLKYIAICNPATREVRFLPDVPHEGEDFICSISFEPEENKYKVVVTIESRAWVFTLGIDKSWREMIKYDKHGFSIAGYISGICISGIIYRVSLDPDYCIVAFDVKSEIFTSITMSIELCRKFSDCDNMLIEVNGKLGIMNYCDYWFCNDIYLWVFDEDEE